MPAASVTVIVTAVTPVPTIVPAVGDWVIIREAVAVQLSVAVTPVVKFGTDAWQFALAFAAWLEPQDDIVGAVASTPAATFAVTVAVQLLKSVTVYTWDVPPACVNIPVVFVVVPLLYEYGDVPPVAETVTVDVPPGHATAV